MCCPHALWMSPVPLVKGRPSFQRLGPNARHLCTPHWLSHPTSSLSAYPPTSTCNQTLNAFLSRPAGAIWSSALGPAGQWQLPRAWLKRPRGCPRPWVKPRSRGALCPGPRPLWPQSCSLGLALRLPHRPPLSACPAPAFLLSGTFVLQFPPPRAHSPASLEAQHLRGHP